MKNSQKAALIIKRVKMIEVKNENLLNSQAKCLVNTVNCEGFMGKGISYQFKEKFPKNNQNYIAACKEQKFHIGNILFFEENEKIIANFPTKNKWREKSQYKYIELGLQTLKNGIIERQLSSIAIPPLGCGNGGLDWSIVKKMIIENLENINTQIILYEPSKAFDTPKKVDLPKMNASHLILMRLKKSIDKNKFYKITLQKAAYFLNIFSGNDYFKFEEYKFGPYAHSIEILSQQIKAFQNSYKIKTDEAEKIIYSSIISNGVKETLKKYEFAIAKSANFVNSIHSNHELEMISTIMAIIKNNPQFTNEEIIYYFFNNWPKYNKNRFTKEEVKLTLDKLVKSKIIIPQLIGYSLNSENLLDDAKPTYC